MEKAIRTRNVKFLCRWLFNESITPLQENLIRKVAFQEYKRFSICAMTRWGKSFCVSRGIGLFILMNRNKKVIFVAPQKEQASILRDYMADLIYKCPALTEITDLDVSGLEKIKKQASRSRQTFKNDCEYRVFTAHGGGEGMMGFGLGSEGGIIVVDESALVDGESWAKITRMLGDNPDKSTIIELLNPWDRASKAFEHWNDPDYYKVRVSWQDALKDGRTTREFIEQQRKEMTDLEFQVLYDSVFPLEAEDSVFNLARIKEAIKIGKENFNSSQLIIACDVADKGLDWTVIMQGVQHKETKQFLVKEIYSEPKSESTDVAGRIKNIIKENRYKYENIRVNIDCIGVGTGVVSMVKEYVEENKIGNCIVNGCHFGEKPELEPERFLNKKGENYFRLKEIMEAGMLGIPDNKDLNNQLVAMKWKFSSTSKIVIEDPDKSPDFADCLVYFCWFIKPEIDGGFYV